MVSCYFLPDPLVCASVRIGVSDVVEASDFVFADGRTHTWVPQWADGEPHLGDQSCGTLGTSTTSGTLYMCDVVGQTPRSPS